MADEVRKLAERSQRETKAISELIRDVQQRTDEVVGTMKQSAGRVQDRSERVDRAGAALAAILNAVDRSTEIVEEIASTAQDVSGRGQEARATIANVAATSAQVQDRVEEMAVIASEVGDQIQRITAVATQNSAATEEVAATAEEMSDVFAGILDRVRGVATTADDLHELVTSFQLEDESDDVDEEPAPASGWNAGHAAPRQETMRRAS